MRGTRMQATVKRVVDGDTVYIREFEKSIRILSLDTEESHPASHKPVTPWGRAASQRAKELLPEGSTIYLEFQGQDPVDEVWTRYVDNFGRGLAWIHLVDGSDFQEIMIKEGYSPYFSKYGYAEWPELHEKYSQAERIAQAANQGVWNQMEVNGSVMRNYAVLSVWWDLRARRIQKYRQHKNNASSLYNTRKDYNQLLDLANQGETVTLFTELQHIKRPGEIHGLISIGSNAQPFELFIRNISDPKSMEIIDLIRNRYLPTATDECHPRFSYAYITGKLQMFRGKPQMVLEAPNAIQDSWS